MYKFLFSLFLIVSIPVLANAQSYYHDTTPKSRLSQNFSPYASPAQSGVRYQRGYAKTDGSYVEGHYKTRRNKTNLDNFSTGGNSNPYTGQSGSRAQDYSPNAASYGSGRTIYTGPRGGQYYINGNGNKTYVPKQPKSYSSF